MSRDHLIREKMHLLSNVRNHVVTYVNSLFRQANTAAELFLGEFDEEDVFGMRAHANSVIEKCLYSLIIISSTIVEEADREAIRSGVAGEYINTMYLVDNRAVIDGVKVGLDGPVDCPGTGLPSELSAESTSFGASLKTKNIADEQVPENMADEQVQGNIGDEQVQSDTISQYSSYLLDHNVICYNASTSGGVEGNYQTTTDQERAGNDQVRGIGERENIAQVTTDEQHSNAQVSPGAYNAVSNGSECSYSSCRPEEEDQFADVSRANWEYREVQSDSNCINENCAFEKSVSCGGEFYGTDEKSEICQSPASLPSLTESDEQSVCDRGEFSGAMEDSEHIRFVVALSPISGDQSVRSQVGGGVHPVRETSLIDDAQHGSNANSVVKHTLHSQVENFWEHSCPSCDKRFSRMKSLKRHMKTHTKPNERMYACTICGKTFHSQTILCSHMESHGETQVCTICQKLFASRSSLRNHMKLHEENRCRAFKCDLCAYAGFTKEALIVHRMRIHGLRRVHEPPSRFRCALCRKQTTTEYGMDAHMRICHEK